MDENAVYRLQIPALIPEIFNFEKCVKYANEMTDDVIYSTQNDTPTAINAPNPRTAKLHRDKFVGKRGWGQSAPENILAQVKSTN